MVSRNVVGYLDYRGNFKAWTPMGVILLEPLAPIASEAGNEILAWVNRNRTLQVLYQGMPFPLEDQQPKYFHCIDNVMIYEMQGGAFKVFHDGRVTLLESYEPRVWKADHRTVAWLTYTGHVRTYSNGELTKASDRVATGFEVFGDVVVSFVNDNRPQIFWNGKIY